MTDKEFQLLISNCCELTNDRISELIIRLNKELNDRNKPVEGLGINVVETIMANDKR